MKLSVVTTLYDSVPFITELVERTRNELEKLTRDYEIILVDDGSPDESLRVALCCDYRSSRNPKVLQPNIRSGPLSENCRQIRTSIGQ